MIAQLYKLLIYEEGDFFHAHVDTQRSDSMFGTMTVSLPVAAECEGESPCSRSQSFSVC